MHIVATVPTPAAVVDPVTLFRIGPLVGAAAMTVALPSALPSADYFVTVEYSDKATTSFCVNTKTVNDFQIESQFVNGGTVVYCLVTYIAP